MRSEIGVAVAVVVVDVAVLLLFGTAVAVVGAGENAGADVGVVKRMAGEWSYYRPVAAGPAAVAPVTVLRVVVVVVVAAAAAGEEVVVMVVVVVVGVDDGKNRWSQETVADRARLKGDCWKTQGQCQQLRPFAGRESLETVKLQVGKVAVLDLDHLHCRQRWWW